MAMAASPSSSKLLPPLPPHASSSAAAAALSPASPEPPLSVPDSGSRPASPPSFVDPFAIDSATATASTSGRRGSFAVRAARGKFERKKPRVNIGPIGPVDRGKSTLTAASHHGVCLHGKQLYEETLDQEVNVCET